MSISFLVILLGTNTPFLWENSFWHNIVDSLALS
jgi:hypothetical protein